MREIAGAPREVIHRWSSRRQQVMATYDEHLEDFRKTYGRSPTRNEVAEMKDDATLESRQPKAGGVSDLHAAWRSDLSGDELSAINAAINHVPADATTGGRLAADDPELGAKVVSALENQRSWWTRVHVYGEVARQIDAPTREAIELVTERIMLDCVCLEPDADPEYAVLDATKFTSQRILDAEGQIVTEARTRAKWVIAPHPDDRLGDDQVQAIEALTAKPYQLSTIIGPAGAGKTTMLRSVGASYRADGRQICVLTLSAAAARVVTDETGLPATTIAAWRHGRMTLPHSGLVLVDEASMVPTLTLRDLTAAARAKGCRVGLVGDYAQMSSPEAGGLLRDLAALPTATRLTSVRRFAEDWERRASIELQQRDETTTINYLEHGRIVETTSDAAHGDVAEAWFADRQSGLDSLIVTDTNEDAAAVSASCQRLLDRAGLLGDDVGTGADHNLLRIGDQVQTRKNTSELETSDGRRVLNRDVWTITDRRDDGTVIAEHRSRRATVTITPDYLAEHTELAYATTIAGAQGRNADTGHAVVTPRTNAASLYVGMTRGRMRNHAHVVTDGHDHDELQLGHRSGLRAFADAIRRNPDGDTSATTVKKRWAADEQNRVATRSQERSRQHAERWWISTRRSLPRQVQAATDGLDDSVVAAIAALPPSTWRENVMSALRTTDWRSAEGTKAFVGNLRQGDQSTRFDPMATTHIAGHTHHR